MNDHISESFGLSSSKRHRQLLKKKSRLGSKLSRREAWTERFSEEFLPLVSVDVGNVSDEELTLQDANYVKIRQRNATKSSSSADLQEDGERGHLPAGNPEGSKSDPFFNCEFLNLELNEGDTLQSISLKYHCAIADLKRANNLISSQEFYALRHLKIPVRKHGLLTEVLSSASNAKVKTIFEENCNNVRTVNIGIGPMISGGSPKEAAAFFKKMDEDLVKIMLNTKSKKDSLEAAAAALTSPRIHPLVKDPYNGVDCGIQWCYLISFIIIVALIIPIIVALYMYYIKSPNQHHNSEIYSNNLTNETFNPVTKMNVRDKS